MSLSSFINIDTEDTCLAYLGDGQDGAAASVDFDPLYEKCTGYSVENNTKYSLEKWQAWPSVNTGMFSIKHGFERGRKKQDLSSVVRVILITNIPCLICVRTTYTYKHKKDNVSIIFLRSE